MARNKHITMRADDGEIAYYKRVSEAVQKDLSQILREAINRLGKRHKVERESE